MVCLLYIFPKIIVCFLLVLTLTNDIDLNLYESLCDPEKNNGECSNNFDCRCSIVVPTGEHICTLSLPCSSAVPCNSDNQCNSTNSICVIDQRCHHQHLCYPISLNSPDRCPPLTTNNRF